jgi:hypothetical protein
MLAPGGDFIFLEHVFDSMQEPVYIDHPRPARKPNRRARNCERVTIF